MYKSNSFTIVYNIYVSDEAKICNDDNEQPPLTQRDVDVVFIYIQTWPNRWVKIFNKMCYC